MYVLRVFVKKVLICRNKHGLSYRSRDVNSRHVFDVTEKQRSVLSTELHHELDLH